MLDKFRETAITWDKANRKIYESLRVSAGDNEGRKLSVQLVNDGVIEDLSGASLSLFWETRDKANKGLDAFTALDATKGEFEIYYTTGMLSNEGNLNANLVLVDASGRIVSEPFKITVFKGIDDDAIQSSDSFTALTEALIDINDLEQNYAPRLSTLEQNDVSFSQQLQQTTTVLEGIDKTFSDITFATPADLQSAYPDGDTKRYIVASDGKWYWYNGTAWIAGQVAQAVGIPDESVGNKKLKISELEVGSQPFDIEVSAKPFVNLAVSTTTGELIGVGYPDRITSNLVEATRIVFNPSLGNGRFSVYQYNLDGSFIGQTLSGVKTSVNLEPGFLYRVLYAFDAPEVMDIDLISLDLVFYGKAQPLRLQPNSIMLENLNTEVINRIDNSSKSKKTNKFMHLSCDDTLDIFIDIHEQGYSSIFDNPVLAFLKNTHEQYGLAFSFYCWHETVDKSFDLSMFPNTYAAEFKENAHWLKFGLHYLRNDGGNFKTHSTGSAYISTMSELFRICGGADSLDFVPRFHAYLGSLAFIEASRDSHLGLKGLLTSEDVRTNYYLDAYQTEFMQKHDRLYDSQNNLMLFSTDLRLEYTPNVTEALSNIVNNVEYASRSNDLVIFTHEPNLSQPVIQQKIIDCCEFAVTNGYDFDFPQNRLSL